MKFKAVYYARKVVAVEGFAALYRGLPVQLCRNVVVSAIIIGFDSIAGAVSQSLEQK